jgi:hypothetical protein
MPGPLYNYFGAFRLTRAVECQTLHKIASGHICDDSDHGLWVSGKLARSDGETQKLPSCPAFLRLCETTGMYEYFKMHRAYDPILQFSYDKGIEKAFVAQMMAFSRYPRKSVYRCTGFLVRL